MCTYLTQADVINILRGLGYTNDFELFERGLLLMQQRIFICEPDYSVTVCYRLMNEDNNDAAVIVMGITTVYENEKGILINRYSNYMRRRPPIIIKKLAEYYTCAGENKMMKENSNLDSIMDSPIHMQGSSS